MKVMLRFLDEIDFAVDDGMREAEIVMATSFSTFRAFVFVMIGLVGTKGI